MKKILTVLLTMLKLAPIHSVEALTENNPYLNVYYDKLEGGGYQFFADNNHFIPQFINLKFTLTNMSIDVANPVQVVISPGEKRVEIAKILPKDKTKRYSFRSSLSYTNGDPLNIKPDNFIYLVPFEHGTKHKLDQGFGGTFSHRGENYYAMDFSMDIGTPVVAARDGVVIEVKEDSNRGGASASYAQDGNYISVYHSDGTFASYVHLRKNGSIVEVGDRVKMGDIIGYSGNTGLSTGPHLHFSVNIPSVKGVRESIPVKLMGLEGEGLTPKTGNYYYSIHPGKKAFEPIYGKDLTNGDYADYLATVSNTGALKFRTESVDDTTIIFVSNGFDKKVSGTVKFSLKNSVTSKGNSINIELEPLTESFLCIVNPRDISKSFGFSYSISYRVMK